MVLYVHELKQGRKIFLVWTAAVAGFIAMSLFMFPEMKGQMESVNRIFSAMGAFTAAFGMDKLNFGTLVGFYAVECGSIISLGGALFATVITVNVLSKEEKEHTAEFLLAHPQSRAQIQRSKLAAVFTELTAIHFLIYVSSAVFIRCIGEGAAWRELVPLHLAYYLCQIEITMICYAISAFSRANNYGTGMGLTMVLYFMSLLANISDKLKVFHIISPFGYAEGSDIMTDGGLDVKLIIFGMVTGIIFLTFGIVHYQHKDIY